MTGREKSFSRSFGETRDVRPVMNSDVYFEKYWPPWRNYQCTERKNLYLRRGASGFCPVPQLAILSMGRDPHQRSIQDAWTYGALGLYLLCVHVIDFFER